ncbi:MAG: Bax inhibitor-1/YccA family protein [Solirubrobacterales bacterium]|nr:Bax inhibitor-1/YccA family protein [Solirubrobacterales bacterium]
MDDYTSSGYVRSGARAEATTSTLLGQVMFLVAIALGFMTAGALIGQDLSQGTALICFFAGFGMLLVQSFAGERFRVGAFAIGWLYAIGLLLGLGIGPTIGYFLENDGTVLTQAAGGTALIVLGMGSLGFALSKDLASWMRPLTYIILGCVVVSFVMLLLSSGGNPILSAIIAIVSALLIMVDFNYLRKHGTENDAVWLATGIFVSIVNIFLSLLNLLGGD